METVDVVIGGTHVGNPWKRRQYIYIYFFLGDPKNGCLLLVPLRVYSLTDDILYDTVGVTLFLDVLMIRLYVYIFRILHMICWLTGPNEGMFMEELRRVLF